MKVYLVLDVGGTSIKAGVIDCEGRLLTSMRSFDAQAQEGQETILNNLVQILVCTWQATALPIEQLAGIGLAFPGDFEYTQGVCLMRGVAKYDSIYGINLRHELAKRFVFDGPILFLNDISAVALGACHYNHPLAAQGKTLTLCLGTGAGSAFLVDGRLQEEAGGGVPARGWVYNAPFGDSILDDYLSVRGLARLSLQFTGTAQGGRELAQLAQQADFGALQTFSVFGNHLLEGMLPFLESFCPQNVLLGGQITKSFLYFGQPLQSYCLNHAIRLLVCQDSSMLAFQGLLWQQLNNQSTPTL